jgi:REP element-mobilizing transposase RayT
MNEEELRELFRNTEKSFEKGSRQNSSKCSALLNIFEILKYLPHYIMLTCKNRYKISLLHYIMLTCKNRNKISLPHYIMLTCKNRNKIIETCI